MRRLLLVLPVIGMVLNAGCTFNRSPSDPNEQLQQSLGQSEFSREMWMAPSASFIFDEQTQWFNDRPQNPTSARVHGSIGS
jgi:hypothetical protein